MHKFLSSLQVYLRKSLLASLLGVLLFLSTALLPLQAQAASMSSKGNMSDRINVSTQQKTLDMDQEQDGMGENLKDTFDNVREKLNLDEPLPEGTKLFMKQLKGEKVEVNEPIPSGKGQEPLNE